MRDLLIYDSLIFSHLALTTFWNYRSAIASADCFDRYYQLSDFHTIILTLFTTPGWLLPAQPRCRQTFPAAEWLTQECHSTAVSCLSSLSEKIVARTQNPLSSQDEFAQMLCGKSPLSWEALKFVEIWVAFSQTCCQLVITTRYTV